MDYFAEGINHSTKRRRGTIDLSRNDDTANTIELEDNDEGTLPVPSIEDIEDEENEPLELEEITRQEFEYYAYYRSATKVETKVKFSAARRRQMVHSADTGPAERTTWSVTSWLSMAMI